MAGTAVPRTVPGALWSPMARARRSAAAPQSAAERPIVIRSNAEGPAESAEAEVSEESAESENLEDAQQFASNTTTVQETNVWTPTCSQHAVVSDKRHCA